MKRLLLSLLAALALPTAVNAELIFAKKGYLASLPVAPFSAPEKIVITGFPSDTVRPQIFKKADWLSYHDSVKENFRADFYVGLSRRKGNIVSLYVLKRVLFRNTSKKSDYIPRHYITINRFDCANDRSQYNNRIIRIIDAIGDGPEVKGRFLETDPSDTILGVAPGQVRVTIEGYPYWAMRVGSFKEPIEWTPIKLGSYGASHLDYACENY